MGKEFSLQFSNFKETIAQKTPLTPMRSKQERNEKLFFISQLFVVVFIFKNVLIMWHENLVLATAAGRALKLSLNEYEHC